VENYFYYVDFMGNLCCCQAARERTPGCVRIYRTRTYGGRGGHTQSGTQRVPGPACAEAL